jgi:DNA-binding LacI/PurR family transcriptional regulator
LEVPGDVSVVGYDNVSIAGLDHVDLTTIEQPRREMGAEAVRLLLDRLDGGRGQSRHVVIPPTLVVRGSTGPPPARSVPSDTRPFDTERQTRS